MSQQNYGFLPGNFRSGTAHQNPAEAQIDASIFPSRLGPYRSIPGTPDLSNRSSFNQTIPRQHPAYQSAYGTINQHPSDRPSNQPSNQPSNRPGQASQYRSIPGRSNQYPHQQLHPQHPASSGVRPGRPRQTPLPNGTARHLQQYHQYQQNRQFHQQLSRPSMSHQMAPPRSVSRQASPSVLPQNGFQQPGFDNSAQATYLPTPPQQYSQLSRPVQNSPCRELTANQQRDCQQQRSTPPRRPIRIPQPSITDWTTYRIDKRGTRLPKTTPPPQGTYKVGQGIGKTDYSDPRDFFAPTREEQEDVWNALRPTREAFTYLTLIVLDINEMRCLSLGYNASWEEIKRKFVEWVFENFSPDLTTTDKFTETVVLPSYEAPGYTTEGLQTIERKQHNPKEINFFVNGELVVNVEELLLKLERWYGLIEDHRYSPTWPYGRERNAGGYLVQNRDCFACMHCRMNQILCHGFREHVDRKCTPCMRQGLLCSNEEEFQEQA